MEKKFRFRRKAPEEELVEDRYVAARLGRLTTLNAQLGTPEESADGPSFFTALSERLADINLTPRKKTEILAGGLALAAVSGFVLGSVATVAKSH
jgi:hypothetical protein